MIRSCRLTPLTFGILFLLAFGPRLAAAPSPSDHLFDAMMQALGGRDAVAKLHSLAVEAACSGPGGPFTTQVRSRRGAGTYFRQASDDRTTEIWSSPERTWSIAEDGTLQEHPDRVRSFVRGHEFHFLVLEVEERFSKHRLAGSETFAGQPSRRIDMVDSEGAPAALWLNQHTDLPIALEINPAGAAGPVRVFFKDWARFGGIKLFRSFDLTEGEEREFRYDYVTIKLNPPLQDLLALPPDAQRERQAIEKILQTDREAHLRTDAELLKGHLADSLLEVSDGSLRNQSREEVMDFFTANFQGARFHAWEDTTPPIIRLSSDLSMAWVVRHVTVDREDLRQGKTVRSRYTSAYTATYEKRDGGWRMTSVTSTFVPKPQAGQEDANG